MEATHHGHSVGQRRATCAHRQQCLPAPGSVAPDGTVQGAAVVWSRRPTSTVRYEATLATDSSTAAVSTSWQVATVWGGAVVTATNRMDAGGTQATIAGVCPRHGR